MKIIKEEELIESGYIKVNNTLYSKNMSLTEIENNIRLYKNTNGNNKRSLVNKLFPENEIFRKYNKEDNSYIDVINCRPIIKKVKDKEILSFSDAITNLNKSKTEQRQTIFNNNLKILRMYHMGDENKELLFSAKGISIPMEKYPNLLSKNNDFYFNMELHHIAMINGESRDKEDSDPNQWLKSVDMTKYDIINNIDEIDNSNINFIKSKEIEYNKDISLLGLDSENNLIIYTKSISAISRIRELMTILLAPKGVHAAVHSSTRNAGYSFYNKEGLPYALKSEDNYNHFINWLQEEFKFRKTLFSSYEDHIEFLEIDN